MLCSVRRGGSKNFNLTHFNVESCFCCRQFDTEKANLAMRLCLLCFTCRPADCIRLKLAEEEVKPPPTSAKQETQTHTPPHATSCTVYMH